jgi:hypothetical protein
MIPYDELDKALQRWKARTQSGMAEAARQFEESGKVSVVDLSGSVPGDTGLPPPPDRTGEIELGDAEAVVESYEDEPN